MGIRGSTGNWRQKMVEACAIVARVANQTDGSVAHTVQLMLDDPKFRTKMMAEAHGRVSPSSDPDGWKALQTALDKLRGKEGAKL